METLSFDLRMLWPIFAGVALTFVAGTQMAITRIRALKSGKMRLSFYRSYRKGEEPERMAVATRHYSNLFETPVLFYLGCLAAGLLGPAPMFALIAAWLFVAFRVAQSVVHLTSNNVVRRAYCFWASAVMLLTLWISNAVALSAMSF